MLQEQDLEDQQWERLQARWGREPFFVERILQVQRVLEARREDLRRAGFSDAGDEETGGLAFVLRGETAEVSRRLRRRVDQERRRLGRELDQLRLPPQMRNRSFREVRPSRLDIQG